MMHLYVEMLMRVGTQPNATAAMKSDVQALMDWFQVSSWSTLTPEERAKHHEAFAYNGEIFLWEGKAPSPELHGVFQRLAAFMRHLYVAIRDQLNAIYHQRFGIDLPMLTPEVRQVFDRMLASSEQIRHEEEVTKMTALFQTQEQAKMNDAEWAAYKELAQAAQDESISSLQTDSLRQMQWLSRAQSKYLKAQQKQHDAVRADVTLAVTVALEEEPIYQAIKWLKTGEMIGTDGERIQADPRRTSKLDRAALDAMYPTDDGRLDTDRLDWSSIKSLTTVGGLHPDVVAEMFGMQSGDSFVRALLMTPPLDEAITAQVDARMLAEFSDLNSPSKIRLAMDAALHTEARARMVAAELRHVAKATKPVRLMVTAAKRAASQFLQTQLIKDVKSSLYLSAERRATARAEKAMRSGESAAVTAALQQRLLNNQLAQEAIRIQQEVDEGLRYAKQLQTPAAKKRIGADHVDQINALLAQYELGSMTLKAISARVSLAQWIDEQLASGVAPDISPQLLKETRQVPYKVLSVQAFRDLMSALKQIDHTGTQSQYLLTAAKNTQFLAAEREMMQGINVEAKGRVADARTPTTDWGRTVQGLKQFGAMHLKSATIARILDGGKDNGPVWTYLIRTANTRGDQETRMNAEATQTLTKILAPFLVKPMGGKGVFFPSVNRSFNRESVLSIALNVGNAGNLQRLLDGEGWTRERIEPILKSLTAEEWGAVQQIWDFMGSYRPLIAAKQRKLYGVEPNWVEPVPFMVGTADGQIVDMYGGYYPVKYDPQASLKAQTQDDADEAAQLLRGAYTSATTNRSFTKPRADEVKGRPLLYTLAGLYNGVNDVIHDLSWHEWLIDANRLLRSPLIDGAIRNQYGPEWTRQLKTWVEAVAAGSRGIQQDGERALSLLRQGISAAGLGFNVTSAALQITGFNQSIVRVGPTWIARGIGRAISNPLALAREVYERSSFMKHRGMTLFRELNELKNMVRGQTRAEQAVRSGAYLMMMKMQQTVDFPTWWGAYEKGLAAGADEDTAVALADQAVIDSQGSGMLKDLSAIERGGPGMKLFTVFYAYMNTVFQMGTTSAMTAQGKGKLASDMLMLFVVPVALTMALKMALHLGDDDEWDWEKIARTFAAEQLSYLMGTMVVVREFSAASKIVTGDETAGRDYAGPAGVRAIVDVHQALKQGFQFEFDTAFRKSSINLIGDLAGLPSAQINRSIDGIEALLEGRTENPLAVVLGVVKKK